LLAADLVELEQDVMLISELRREFHLDLLIELWLSACTHTHTHMHTHIHTHIP